MRPRIPTKEPKPEVVAQMKERAQRLTKRQYVRFAFYTVDPSVLNISCVTIKITS